MDEDEAQSMTQGSQSGEQPINTDNVPIPGQDVLQTMATAFRQIAGSVTPTQVSVVEKLHKYGAEEFRGRRTDDPNTAEYWLQQLERIFIFMPSTQEEKLQGAISLLKEEAYIWWLSKVDGCTPEMISWEFFVKEFRKRYVGVRYMEERKREFLHLVQGSMSVLEYEGEFRRLSRYAREIVPNEEKMCRRFEQGLNNNIQKLVLGARENDLTKLSELAQSMEELDSREGMEKGNQSLSKRMTESPKSILQRSGKRFKDSQGGENFAPAHCTEYSQEHGSGFRFSSRPQATFTSVASTGGSNRAPLCEHCGNHHFNKCRKLLGVCLGCGATDHYVRDCPKYKDTTTTPSVRSGVSPRREHKSGSNFGTSKGQGGKSEAMLKSEPKVPARTYAMKAQDEYEKSGAILHNI